MPIFGRRGRPESGVALVHDRCWSDPALDALHTAVLDRVHPAPTRVAWVLQHLAAVRHDPERQVVAAKATAETLAASLDDVRAAAGALTGDKQSDADAHALLATVLVAGAWQARGGGRANTVAQEAFRTFHTMLDEADEVGYQALELESAHPVAAVARLDCARGLGVPGEEFWTRFEVATQVRPTLYAAHASMLQALCKKWYGSAELMFDFARRTAANVPIGDPVGAMLVIAHVENLLEIGGTLMVPAEDHDLARYAAGRWVAAGEAAMAAHPYAPAAHQLFGWLLRKRHRPTAFPPEPQPGADRLPAMGVPRGRGRHLPEAAHQGRRPVLRTPAHRDVPDVESSLEVEAEFLSS